MNKRILRTVKLPRGLVKRDIVEAWALLNQSLDPVCECAIWHWKNHVMRDGKFLILPVKGAEKKFRYRAFVQASRLV